MKTTALRLYGKQDLRLESFELPPCGDDGIIGGNGIQILRSIHNYSLAKKIISFRD